MNEAKLFHKNDSDDIWLREQIACVILMPFGYTDEGINIGLAGLEGQNQVKLHPFFPLLFFCHQTHAVSPK